MSEQQPPPPEDSAPAESPADPPAEDPPPAESLADPSTSQVLDPLDESPTSSVARVVILVVLLVGLVILGKVTGVAEKTSVEDVQQLAQSAGAWGALLLIVAFALGELLHIPGLVFVFAGVLAYGQVWGGVVGYVGGVVSVCFSFAVVRGVGGKALDTIKKPWVKRVLKSLDTNPIRTVVILRVVLWMSPQLNYALALTGISFRNYLIGSAFGLIWPIGIMVLFFEQLREVLL